jgi:hypothetical protein
LGDFPHTFTDDERARGHASQRQVREDRRRELEEGLASRQALEAAMDALVRGAHADDIPAAKEIIHQLVGRPTTVVAGDPDRPVRTEVTVRHDVDRVVELVGELTRLGVIRGQAAARSDQAGS